MYSLFSLVILFGTFVLFLMHYPCVLGPVQDCRMVALRNTLLETLGFTLGTLLLVAYATLKKKEKLIELLPMLIVVLICLMGLYNSYKFTPFSKKDTFFPENLLIRTLKATAQPERVFGIGEANIKTNLSTALRLYDPQYYHPLYIKRYGELIGYANSKDYYADLPRSDVEIINSATVSADLELRRSRLFSLLSIEYVVFKKSEVLPDWYRRPIWENKTWYIVKRDSLPRIYAVSNFVVQNNPEKILQTLFSPHFNPETTVVLEKPITNIKLPKNTIKTDIRIKTMQENSILLETMSHEDQILTITDNYYPGWVARIDNEPAALYRANYTFRAIVLPKGNHKIEFAYEPSSFKIGLMLSLTVAIAYAGYVLFLLKKNNRVQ